MKLRPFELTLVIIFGFLAILALGLIATYKPSNNYTGPSLGTSVEIWGTMPAGAFAVVLNPLKEAKPEFGVVQYIQKDARTFDNDLLNALADGVGPDIIFMPHEQLVQYRNKIQPARETEWPLRDFKSTYIDGAEIFALTDGIYAYPVAIDPLVMYYNRDLLSTKNIINPPITWEGVVGEIVPTLVERDFSRTIIRSPLAFGEYRNVQNAFPVLSMLMMQAGSAFVQENTRGYQVLVNSTAAGNGQPLDNALTFYTNFASPSNPLYSWNRAQDMDRNEFLGESLVLYFAKGSEARGLAQDNPNLNFDIAEVPQGATASIRRTYGTFYGFALMRSSDNVPGARVALAELGSSDQSQKIATALGMAPAHRSTLNSGTSDQYGRIIYSAAKVARGWLNPKLSDAEGIFAGMVEDVLANRRRPSEAAGDASSRLSQVY